MKGWMGVLLLSVAAFVLAWVAAVEWMPSRSSSDPVPSPRHAGGYRTTGRAKHGEPSHRTFRVAEAGKQPDDADLTRVRDAFVRSREEGLARLMEMIPGDGLNGVVLGLLDDGTLGFADAFAVIQTVKNPFWRGAML